ncbi:unnamed protein product [Closterium sp. NIES-53]
MLGVQNLVTRPSALADLDYDAILAAMYALSVSAEGDCYLCVLPDPGIDAAALRAGESSLPGPTPAEALHTFRLDSKASRCFFRDSTTLTPLSALVVVRLANPSGGPVLARSSTVLPCSAFSSNPIGIAERRIGLVMEVTRTSMIHAATHHFQWRFAVRYAAHQLNLWPRVCLPETSPTLRWTGKVFDASVFRVRGSRAFVRDLSADKLSTRAFPYVFLGFSLDARGWQFYHPTSRRVFPSQDVTFDESVPFYRLFPYRSAPPPPPLLFLALGPPTADPLPPQGPAPSGVSKVDLLPGTVLVEVAVDSGVAQGAASGGAASVGAGPGSAESGDAESEGAGSGGAESGGAEPGDAEPAGVESEGAEPEGVEPGGAESRGAETRGTTSSRGSAATGAGDSATGDTGPGGAGVTAGAGAIGGAAAAGPRGAASAGPGGARIRGTRAAGTGGVGSAGAEDSTEPGAAGAGGAGAGAAGAVGAGAGGTGAVGAIARGAGAVDPGAEGAGAEGASQPLLQPASALPAPSPYTEQTRGLTERRVPASRPASPVRIPCPRPPQVPGTHAMALCPSSVPLRVPLLAPPESSLPAVPDPESDGACAASPTVSRFLATIVTDPSFETTGASAPIAELVDFAAAYRLDYATALLAESVSVSPLSIGVESALGTYVLEDRQEDFECFAAAVPRFASMLLAPEGDPDAPEILTPRSYAEAITGPYSS